jgi:hypothetical protein
MENLNGTQYRLKDATAVKVETVAIIPGGLETKMAKMLSPAARPTGPVLPLQIESTNE